MDDVELETVREEVTALDDLQKLPLTILFIIILVIIIFFNFLNYLQWRTRPQLRISVSREERS